MDHGYIIAVCVISASIFAVFFVIWLENTKRFKWNDIWCDVCKKDVEYWSSHVYSKEHVDNLSKRSDIECLVK